MMTDGPQSLHDAILADHRLYPHPDMDANRLRLHFAIHEVVENQIRDGKPKEVTDTLNRLVSSGVSRHDAIHALGVIAMEEVFGYLRKGEVFNEARYVARLAELGPKSHS